jgi:hypothetical protein
MGKLDKDGPSFSRQILLTRFLAGQPSAIAPSSGLMPDGRILICYETSTNRAPAQRLSRRAVQRLPERLARHVCKPKNLRYVSGTFSSLDRCVSFSGREHHLALPSGAVLRGRHPALAVAPDGRVLIVYESAGRRGLCYYSGTLDASGRLIGQVYELGAGPIYAGVSPAIAIDDAGRVVIVYQEAESRTLECMSGFIDPSGRITANGIPLALPGTSLGCHPSVAVDGRGRAFVAYQVCATDQISCVSVTYNDAGFLDCVVTPVLGQGLCRGRYPNVVSSQDDDIALVYASDADHSLRYQHLFLSDGRLEGEEKPVIIKMRTD